MRREKELNTKAESADAARNTIDNADSRIEELELQLQKCIIERNDIEIKMEEAIQDAGKIINQNCTVYMFKVENGGSLVLLKCYLFSGRNDVKTEFRVMASALSKEMGMMEGQLNHWKETAHKAISLREEARALKVLLSDKVFILCLLVFLGD